MWTLRARGSLWSLWACGPLWSCRAYGALRAGIAGIALVSLGALWSRSTLRSLWPLWTCGALWTCSSLRASIAGIALGSLRASGALRSLWPLRACSPLWSCRALWPGVAFRSGWTLWPSRSLWPSWTLRTFRSLWTLWTLWTFRSLRTLRPLRSLRTRRPLRAVRGDLEVELELVTAVRLAFDALDLVHLDRGIRLSAHRHGLHHGEGGVGKEFRARDVCEPGWPDRNGRVGTVVDRRRRYRDRTVLDPGNVRYGFDRRDRAARGVEHRHKTMFAFFDWHPCLTLCLAAIARVRVD